MPNHVMNRLTFRAAQARVDQVLAEIAYAGPLPVEIACTGPPEKGVVCGPGTFDFNKVIPMPDDIDWSAPLYAEAYVAIEGRNWYHWSLVNWGTKWNSYNGSRTGPNSISFHTAWLPVLRVIEALSRKYPDVEIEYAHCDTGDWGAHVGTSTWRNGDCVRANSPKAPIGGRITFCLRRTTYR